MTFIEIVFYFQSFYSINFTFHFEFCKFVYKFKFGITLNIYILSHFGKFWNKTQSFLPLISVECNLSTTLLVDIYWDQYLGNLCITNIIFLWNMLGMNQLNMNHAYNWISNCISKCYKENHLGLFLFLV